MDIVRKGFKAHWNKQLLQLFQELHLDLGPNIEQTLLGGVDPIVEYISLAVLYSLTAANCCPWL
jgi:hypothetical protein